MVYGVVYAWALANIYARCVGIMHSYWLALMQGVWCLCTNIG